MEDLLKRLSDTQTDLEKSQTRVAELEARLALLAAERPLHRDQDRQRFAQEQALQRMAQRLNVIHILDRALLSAHSLDDLADLALSHVVELVPCFRAAISTINLDEMTIYPLVVRSGTDTAITDHKTYALEDVYIRALANDQFAIIRKLDQSPNAGLRQLYAEGVRSTLLVALRVEGDTIGLLNLHSVDSDYFTDERIEIAIELGDHIALGIHKTGLSEKMAQHAAALEESARQLEIYTRRMEILRQIDRGIIAASSIQGVIETALRHIRRIIPCQMAAAVLLDPMSNAAVIFAADLSAPTVLQQGIRYRIPPGFFDGFEDGTIKVVDDLADHPELQDSYKNIIAEGMRSFLHVLLKAQDQTIGALVLNANTPGFFTAEFQQIAAEIGNQIAIATNQMQLSEKLQRYARRMEILHQIDLGLITGTSTRTLIENTLTQLNRLIPCQGVVVNLLDSLTGEGVTYVVNLNDTMTLPEGTRFPVGAAILAAFNEHNFRLEDDLRTVKDPTPMMKRLLDQGVVSVFSILLKHGDTLLGSLALLANDPGFFTTDYQEIALEVASQLAIAIHQLQLSERLRRYAQRMEILHAIDRGLIEGGSAAELIRRTLARIRDLIPCREASIGLFNPGADELTVYALDLTGSTNLPEGTKISLSPDALMGYDARNLRVTDDLRELPVQSPVSQKLIEDGFVSALSVLLKKGDEAFGVFFLFADTPRYFHSEYQDIAVEIGSQLAIAFHQIRLSEALERQAAELEQRVVERTAELQASKDRIAAILNNSLDGILLIERDLSIQQANFAFDEMFSADPDRLSPATLLDIMNADDADRVRATVEMAANDELHSQIEVRAHRQDGTPVDIEVGFGHIPGDGLVSTLHDITGRKQAEEALKLALEKEKEVADTKSRFVSIASHEFRTPLASILAAADTLSTYRDRMSRDQIDQRLEKIRNQVSRMNRIMEDVLQLSRIQSGRLQYAPVPGDLDELCRDIIEEFSVQNKCAERLTYLCETHPVAFSFDPPLIRQAINNLISNALKYSPPNQTVTVTLRADPGRVVLKVTDHGIGIPEQDLGRLFEPFHRATNVGAIPGTGLGLSITSQIVEMHGGTIEVDSQVGRGTTFSVVIPRP